MRGIVRNLSDTEIAALAAYLESLGGGQKTMGSQTME